MKRYGLLLLATLSGLLSGASCLPLIDRTGQNPPTGTTLAAVVTDPAGDRDVPQGQSLTIEWSAVNRTNQDATVSILVENTDDSTQTTLAEGLTVDSEVVDGVFEWDTTGFDPAVYSLIAKIQTATDSAESTGPGQVTVNEPPTFEFTEPSSPETVDSSGTVTISWTGGDANGDGTARLGIDLDTDHESGNEIFISEQSLPVEAGDGIFDWNGNDDSGDRVDAGTYNLFAVVGDGANDDQIVNGLARITVLEEIDLGITEPSEDVEFIVGDPALTIDFELDEEDDVLIDLKIDTDTNHANGNETAILLQRVVTADTTSDSFDWDATDATGAAVDPGIYSLFIVMNTGAGTPQTAGAAGLVFRRDDADQPLIGLLQPSATVRVLPGEFVTIRWRDDDPTEDATIRLSIDDDRIPGEATETGEPEVEILTDREADPDGIQDSFAWQVPSMLVPGTYWVFAFIDSDAAAPDDHSSISPAVIVVRDPAEEPAVGVGGDELFGGG